MCDSGDRRRACIFVHLDNLDIIVTATKPPFSWTKALRLYYTHIVPRSSDPDVPPGPRAGRRASAFASLRSRELRGGIWEPPHTDTRPCPCDEPTATRERKPRAAR